MRRVYVLEPGTYLKRSGENLVLMSGEKVVEEIGVSSLEQLTLIGYTSLSGAVLDLLIQHRVETIFLDPLGRFRGRLFIDEHKHVKRRVNQYLKLSDRKIATDIARSIVLGKIRAQSRFLSLKGKQINNNEVSEISIALKALVEQLKKTDDIEIIRGIEGHASRLYFQGFAMLIKQDGLSFSGRNKRPPRDPVNALLSFVYTLLTNEVLTCIKVVGLDPYLGALHEIEYGRPSLACDLVEEWRVFLGDRFVLNLINRNMVKDEDFVRKDVKDTDFVDEYDLKQKRPVEMKPNTCRAFLRSYEKWMTKTVKNPYTEEFTSYRNLILYQVRKFENFILGNDEIYNPFMWSKVL